MPESKCIKHEPERLLILRPSYLRICDDDHCAASLLNVFEYWHDVRLDQIEQEKAHAKADNDYRPNLSLNIFKTMEDLDHDVMGSWSEPTIKRGLDIIVGKGFITREDNKKNKFDKTKIYRFLPGTVQLAVDAVKSPSRSKKNSASVEKILPMSYIEITESTSEITENLPIPKTLAANAAATDGLILPIGGGSGKESLKPDGLENTSMEEELELEDLKPNSAPSEVRTGSEYWTPSDERTFWSRYKALPKAKTQNPKTKRMIIHDLVNKLGVGLDDALLALGPFAEANRGTLNLREFVKYFDTYLAEGKDVAQKHPQARNVENAALAIGRAPVNQTTKKGSTPQPPNLLTQPGALTAPAAITRWNEIVKSNQVLYDPTMDKSREKKLGVLCQEERFARAFDEICRKCEAICSVVPPEEWRPKLWWLAGLSTKDGTANWYRILVGDFDFMANSKKTKGNAALDRARAKYE